MSSTTLPAPASIPPAGLSTRPWRADGSWPGTERAAGPRGSDPLDTPRRPFPPGPVRPEDPLAVTTFVVVDLETTGSDPATDAVTEIGAVRVRGGEVLGEFATLVDPGRPIPPTVTVLTGLTDRVVAAAPRIGAVLPAFAEFAHGAVLVAHNAPFDVGFLLAAAAACGTTLPAWPVLDTVRLARAVLTRDEAPDCRLSTLARLFRSATPPSHRALADARATVDVLHGLIERVGPLGVDTVGELCGYSARVSPAQRRKRWLARDLHEGPGVYTFRAADGRALYVGTSGRVRERVASYFTAAETRSRIGEMLTVAEGVDVLPAATALAAEITELRLLATLKPPYNRRSRFPERSLWVGLTAEPFPRLGLRTAPGPGRLGPFGSRRRALAAVAALEDALPLRRCTSRLPREPAGPDCVLGQIDRCCSPCTGALDRSGYGAVVVAAAAALDGDARAVAAWHAARMARCAATERFAAAARSRDRLAAYLDAAADADRVGALRRCARVLAAAVVRGAPGCWDVHDVRDGLLAGAWRTTVTDALPPPDTWRRGPVPAAPPVLGDGGRGSPTAWWETLAVLRWLRAPGTRLLAVDGQWVGRRASFPPVSLADR